MATIKFTSAGGIEATSFKSTSSRKFKKDIAPTKVSGLDIVNSTDVVDFKFISDIKEVPHVGFIAEDTDPILSTPELDGMDYTNCIGVLLKAVQELTEKVENLEDEIRQLKK